MQERLQEGGQSEARPPASAAPEHTVATPLPRAPGAAGFGVALCPSGPLPAGMACGPAAWVQRVEGDGWCLVSGRDGWGEALPAQPPPYLALRPHMNPPP